MSDRPSDLRALLVEKLGATGRDLRAQLARAGRRLPRKARRDAEFLVRAETMASHPRFARLIDPREVTRAEKRLAHRLRAIDPAAERRRRHLDYLALAGLHVLVTFALVVGLLWWGGLV
jgi:hypothetical protein